MGSRARTERDGFTLIETIMVVGLLGLVSLVIAMTFSVITRTTPSTEARTDDSRSLLGLTNWIAQDVSSTSEDGFDFDYTMSGCASGIPASKQLVRLNWQDGSTTYVADYRYVHDSDTGTIFRYSCKAGEAARAFRLTAELQNASTGTFQPAPVAIARVPTVMADGTNGYKGLQMQVFVYDNSGAQRELLSLDATTDNVMTTLPPIGGGGGSANQTPTAAPSTAAVTAGQSVTFMLSASDAEGVNQLVTTFPDTTTWPPNGYPNLWNVTTSGINVTVTPDLAATGSYTFAYRVTDSGSPAKSADSTITVTVAPVQTNQPPTASPVTIYATRGVESTVDLSLYVTDPESQSVTYAINASTLPNNWATPTLTGSILHVTPHNSAAGQYSMTYTATDSGGASSPATSITINVCNATISSTNAPNQGVTVNSDGSLAQSVQVNITDTTFCGPLVLGFKPKASQAVESTETFGTDTFVVVQTTEYIWDVPTSNSGITNTLNLRQGANGPIVDTDTFKTKKP